MKLFGRLLITIVIVFGPLILGSLIFQGALWLYEFGGCSGALGSGVTCVKGDGYGLPALYLELAFLSGLALLPVAWAFLSGLLAVVVWLVIGVRALLRRGKTA